jgi:hypothetical protein
MIADHVEEPADVGALDEDDDGQCLCGLTNGPAT